MKRVFVLVLVLMLCAGALADTSIDWKSMSDEEISAIIEAGQAELKSRVAVSDSAFVVTSGTVLINTNGITVTVSDEPRIFVDSVCFDVVIENHSEYEARIIINDVKVDGWEEHGVCGGSVGPGMKARETCLIDLSGPQIKTVEEIKDCFLRMKVSAAENGIIFDSGEIELIFNN